MRTIMLGLLLGSCTLAQTPATPTATQPKRPVMSDKSQQALADYLKRWEERFAKLDGLETRIIMTEIEGSEKSIYTGEAAVLRPNYARLEVKDQTDPDNNKRWRHYLADGTSFWDFNHAKKTIRRNILPKEGLGQFTLLAFLMGLKADDIQKRYELFIDVDDPKKRTDHYLFITIYPKDKEDEQVFTKAELVLWISQDPKYADYHMLPARIWYQQANKNQYMWEFRNMKTGGLKPANFKAPQLGRDWTIVDESKP